MAIRLALGLLFIVNVLRDCSYAHAHQQDWEMDKDKLVVPEDTVSAMKELVASCTRKLGGRKMGAHEVLMRRKFKKDTSGEQNHASVVKSLQGSQAQYLNLNELQNVNNLKPKTQKSDNWNTNPKHFHQESKKLLTKASLENLSLPDKQLSHQTQAIAPKGETQRLLEATKEIVNLMTKDYRGMDRPRRKPPINNHVPIH
ncbi:hypothetical protein MANES_02G060950v8 [Manihot esculenta]|uniref:Uncharacterized protein n=1 Tax=Manihot esculenta TaxID=3983 RepID=A0ACB7I5S2_MANES|nr:hypothetical protein MANES_02G060950v8 [Manihot esculenta]